MHGRTRLCVKDWADCKWKALPASAVTENVNGTFTVGIGSIPAGGGTFVKFTVNGPNTAMTVEEHTDAFLAKAPFTTQFMPEENKTVPAQPTVGNYEKCVAEFAGLAPSILVFPVCIRGRELSRVCIERPFFAWLERYFTAPKTRRKTVNG